MRKMNKTVIPQKSLIKLNKSKQINNNCKDFTSDVEIRQYEDQPVFRGTKYEKKQELALKGQGTN